MNYNPYPQIDKSTKAFGMAVPVIVLALLFSCACLTVMALL